MTPNPEELKRRVRELSEKATEAPWEADNWGTTIQTDDQIVCVATTSNRENDSELIAYYRTAAPALCDLLDASERREAELRKALEDAPHHARCESLFSIIGQPEQPCTCWKSRALTLLKPQPPKP